MSESTSTDTGFRRFGVPIAERSVPDALTYCYHVVLQQWPRAVAANADDLDDTVEGNTKLSFDARVGVNIYEDLGHHHADKHFDNVDKVIVRYDEPVLEIQGPGPVLDVIVSAPLWAGISDG